MFEFDVWKDEMFAEPDRFLEQDQVAVNLSLGDRVADLPLSEPVVIGPGTSISEALRLLSDVRVDAGVIVGHGIVLGLVTARDLTRAWLATEGSRLVVDVMRRDGTVFGPDDSLAYVLGKVRSAHGERAFPVVSAEGDLLGVLDLDDLFDALTKQILGPGHVHASSEAGRQPVRS